MRDSDFEIIEKIEKWCLWAEKKLIEKNKVTQQQELGAEGEEKC